MTITAWGRRIVACAALAATASLAAGCAPPSDEAPYPNRAPAQSSASIAEVRRVLDAQAAAWNSGDIRGFMDGYARSDTLRFASGGSVFQGWDVTLERYQAAYADEELMGSLGFSDVDVWPLSERHAVVFGRWALDRSARVGDAGGLFTLLFENGPGGWKIVHDHTSVDASTRQQQQDSTDTTS